MEEISFIDEKIFKEKFDEKFKLPDTKRRFKRGVESCSKCKRYSMIGGFCMICGLES